MKTLKKMIFKLLSQTLSMKEFETWLYQDEFIKSQILRNEMIFELVNINLRSKHAFEELTDFCFNHFDKEECWIQIVKYNCEILLENKTNNMQVENARLVSTLSSDLGWIKSSLADIKAEIKKGEK